MTTFDVGLPGCAPAPLASYLKALGILRLVAEQADAGARGWWRGSHFVLTSTLDADVLRDFFLDRYAPTPIIAPWNGGSGFYAGDNRNGFAALAAATAPRFGGYVKTIAAAEGIRDALGLQASPKNEAKVAFLARIRGALPDDALAWFDAAVLLGSDHVLYPPLLGTGGNDGRLDFTNNVMQRLVELIDPVSGQALPGSDALISEALFGEPVAGLASAAVGQFAPGAAGGPNATAGLEGDSRVNPWDFTLMLEGALLFAAAATRRNETDEAGALSFPFTVRATAAGSGHAVLKDETSSRAELWMPLWTQPAGYAEVRALLAEGRVTLGRRPARDGLDFVRAVSKLGVDRGISRFQRYGLMMRSGKAFLATPLTQVRVQRNARAELIDQLDNDGWLLAFRRLARQAEAPARLSSLGRRLDQALFNLAAPGGNAETPDPAGVQAALMALGDAVTYLARSPKAREAIRSLPYLDKDWVQAADDESDEFRLAAAIAGLGAASRNYATEPQSEQTDHSQDNSARNVTNAAPRLLVHIAPVDDNRYQHWAKVPPRRVVWGEGTLVDNLIRVIRRRLLDAERAGAAVKPLDGVPGADLAAIAAFLAGITDDTRIEALVRGLALVRKNWLPWRRSSSSALPVPAAYAALKPLFMPESVLRVERPLSIEARLPLPATLLGQLLSGRTDEAIRQAQSRARIAGLGRSFAGLGASNLDGRRLAAALLIPIQTGAARRLFDIAYPVPDAARQEGSAS